VLLSLGTIATAAGIAREIYVYRAFIGFKDPTCVALPLWICADVEIYVGLASLKLPSRQTIRHVLTRDIQLCACVPSLRPLWTEIGSWFLSCKAKVLHLKTSSSYSTGDCVSHQTYPGTISKRMSSSMAPHFSTRTAISGEMIARRAMPPYPRYVWRSRPHNQTLSAWQVIAASRMKLPWRIWRATGLKKCT